MTARTALFLVSPVPEAAGSISGWLEAGNCISEIWYSRPRNRGMIHRDARLAVLAPHWSVSRLARKHGIAMREVPPLSNWAGAVETARSTGSDAMISCMFSFRIPQEMLALFGARAVNLHPAPLPQYRGPHTTYAMILDGSITTEACVTLHVMAPEFDTGDVIAVEPFDFPETGSMMQFFLHCGRAGYRLTATAVPRYLDGELPAVPQDKSRAGYPRLDPGDLAIGPHVDLKAVRRMFATLGSLEALRVAGVHGIKAAKLSAVLGSPSGEPPAVRQRAIDCDIADARIRMRRSLPWSSAAGKLVRLLSVMTAARPRD
ncbi:formyltransferase family protein [Oricola indica]|uniref:formyltransferase family protein n=1 Tax=Oricola indica TaxID=2872591 RepID=UPI003CCBEE7A